MNGGGDGSVVAVALPPDLVDVPRPAARQGRSRALVAVLVVTTMVVGLAAWSVMRSPAVAALPEPARRASEAFLDRYLTDDGRVVRLDQGGDTVSEGQAYALLLTQALGDEERFETVWEWTETNLARDDGLLAWRWDEGRVVDSMPAADADVDAAWALLLAAERFDDDRYRTASIVIAEAVLDNETVNVAGEAVLVAGPWAAVAPYTVNPSYSSPTAFAALERASRDQRWGEVAKSSLRLAEQFTDGSLPPDWASVEPSGVARPAPSPDGVDGPAYGLDAARLSIRSAAACESAWRAVAASVGTGLAGTAEEGAAQTLTLDGQPLRPAAHATTAVAAAAAASAAGDEAGRDRLLGRATTLEQQRSTYYGAAWLALGQVLLATSSFDNGCTT